MSEDLSKEAEEEGERTRENTNPSSGSASSFNGFYESIVETAAYRNLLLES